MSTITENNIIEVKNLCCKSGNRYLIRDINWEVKQGDHWVVFGMNGSGKTTLLSVIAGFKYYSSGTVKVFGEEYSDENILNIRKKIGWVSASFFDKYYTRESALNIVLSGRNGTLGLDGEISLKDVKLAKALLTEFGLGDRVDRTFDMFSKGERQNILIARALISNPEILILDEPCTGLDVYNRSYLFETIKKLDQMKGLTIIYVTHYPEEILPIFQNIMLLKNGSVYKQGKLADTLNEESMKALLGYNVNVATENDGTYRISVKAESNLEKLFMQ